MNLQNYFQNLISWTLTSGIKIIAISITAFLINRFFQVFIERIVKGKIKNRISEGEKKQRIETLTNVFGGTARFIIWIAAILMIMSEFGLNITPILTGIGVVGLAVGMAAKDIMSDFISGFFIILENQYHIGDKVKIAGIEGKVKEMTLRRTIIEDEKGFLHSIPNSHIKLVSKKIK